MDAHESSPAADEFQQVVMMGCVGQRIAAVVVEHHGVELEQLLSVEHRRIVTQRGGVGPRFFTED